MIVGRDDDQLTPFEALHLVRAGRLALSKEPDAILESAVVKIFTSNGTYLEAHPDELADVQRLIVLSQEMARGDGD